MTLKKFLIIDARFSEALRLKNPEVNRLKPFAAFFAHSGDSWFIEIALFILWLVTRSSLHQMIALMAGAVVVLALLVLAVKFTIRRQRPEGDWGAIYRNTDPHSFPSGHAARTAMLATLALGLGFQWLGILLFVWMILVSLARVWMGVHYLSDIIAGILVGVLFGIFMSATAHWFYKLLPWIFSDRSSLIVFKYFSAILA
ncbi:MAG: phosphatase PAP2 family protein [Anaerolineaceae bacterium]